MPYLVAASLLWSLSFALISRLVGGSGVEPDLLTALRLGLAALAFAPFLAFGRGRPGRPLALVAIGAVQFGLMYVLVMRSYRHLAGHEVALLTITTPLLVVALDAVIERRGLGRAALAALIATAAAAAIERDGDGGGRASFWTGVALVQGANLAFAAGQVAYRRLFPGAPATRAASGFALCYVGAAAVALPFAAATNPEGARGVAAAAGALSSDQWWTVLYLGLVPSGLAFYLWNVGATRVGVGALAVMNNLKVPLAVAVALLPPFDEWRGFDGTASARLAASGLLFALALAVARGGGRAGPQARAQA